MSMYVRQLTIDELKFRNLKHPKPARQVQRAKIIWFSHQLKFPKSLRKLLFRECSRIRRFNKLGLSGLLDAPRTGRPKYYTQETHGKVIALARTKQLRVSFRLLDVGFLQRYGKQIELSH